MNVFKYRGEHQLDFVLDIIREQRLYCSTLTSLNDPCEGRNAATYWGRSKRIRRQEEAVTSRIRICSLSRTLRSHLLWSHYASGLRGAVVEVEIPDPIDQCNDLTIAPVVTNMNYGHFTSVMYRGESIDTIVFRKLSLKLPDWSYEQEIRIIAMEEHLSDHSFFSLNGQVQSVIMGTRMAPESKRIIYTLCCQNSIPTFVADATPHGVHIFSVTEEGALQGGIWQDEQGVSHFEPLVVWEHEMNRF